MSISSTNRKAGPYSCNGATVAFPFAFKVFAAADVRVVLTDADGVEIDLVLGSGYTVALNSDQDTSPGGTVTTVAPYATGYLVTLTSQLQSLQPVVLTNVGGFYPKVVNDALDRVTILVQQLGEQVGRAVKVGISSVVSPDALMAQLSASVASALGYSTAAAGSASDAADSAAQAASSAADAAVMPTLRNRLINGDCVAVARGDTPLVANVSMYGGCDRILSTVTATTASGTIKQEAGLPTVSGFAAGIVNLTTTGATSVAWTERIESRNCRLLNGATVTLQSYVYQETGATRTLTVGLNKAGAVDNFSTSTAVGGTGSFSIPSGVWTRFTFTTTLGASDADNGLSAYAAFNGLPALTAKNFYLGDRQLEKGSVATVLEQIPVGLTRLLCARYCAKIGGNIAAEDIGHGVYTSSTDCRAVVRYQVPLRTNSPSVTFVGPASDWTAYDASSRSASAVGVNTSCRDSLNFSLTVSGATAGQAAYIRSQSASTYILVSAEL